MRDRIWRTADKRLYLVGDMETSHINNAIAMILRKKNWRRAYLPRLQLELQIRAIGLTTKRTT